MTTCLLRRLPVPIAFIDHFFSIRDFLLTPTHLVTAQTAFLFSCVLVGHSPSVTEAGVAAVAALIPDLDSRQSYVGRLVRPLAAWLEDSFGHRTLTHSLIAQAGIAIQAYWLLPFGFFLALTAGWLSHSFADM